MRQSQRYYVRLGLSELDIIMEEQSPIGEVSIDKLRQSVTRSQDVNKILSYIIGYVFGSQERFTEISKACEKMPKAVCAKSIGENELTYKCYDCGHNNQFHIYCERCFLDGQHKGHRYLQSLQRSGCCDCGDESALEIVGFCKNHGGFAFLSNLNMNVDDDIQQRLDKALEVVFGQLFALCDQKQFDGLDEAQVAEIMGKSNVILETMAIFVEIICKEKLPILFAVCKVLEKKRTFTLRHICDGKTFDEMFRKGSFGTHICNASITELIFKYSIIVKGQKQNLTKIIFTLFINASYKKYLVEKYVQNYRFMTALGGLGQQLLQGELHNLFTQFFSLELVSSFLHHKEFVPNIFSSIGYYASLLKDPTLFEQAHAGFCCGFHLLNYFEDRIREHSLEAEGFEVMGNLLRQAFQSVPIMNKVVLQQKYRLHSDYLFVNLFGQYMKTVKGNTQDTKNRLAGLVKLYVTLLDKENLEQYAQCPQQWYGEPERLLGIILLVYLLKSGLQSTKEMFNSIVNSDLLQKICHKLFNRFNFCELKLVSTYVGFLGQQTQKDITKYFYRMPEQLLYDSDQLCTQMISMVCNPQFFIKFFLENVLPEHQLPLMLCLNSQESFAINIGEIAELGSHPLLFQSKKNYIINAFEIKKKIPVQAVKEVFDKTIFSLKNVKLEDGLAEVADYDKESGLFSLKKEYANLLERIYLVRNSAVYSKLHEKVGDVSADDFKRDNIIIKMATDRRQSICSLVSENISKSIGFMSNFLCKSFRSLWDLTSKDFKTNYNQLKLLSVFLTRNSNHPKFRQFIEAEYQHIVDKQTKSPVQAILSELLTGLNAQNKLPEDVPVIQKQSSKASNRKKEILEEMKRQRMKFAEKHKEETLAEADKKETFLNKCLICHQDTQQWMVITMHSIYCETLPGKVYQSYNSCYHTFHFLCISKQGYDLCPLCRLPFSYILPEIFHKFCLHSVKQPVRMELPKDAQLLNEVMMFVAFLVKEKDNTGDVDSSTIEEMLVSKLQLAIQDSAEVFFGRILPSLKSLLCIGVALEGASPEKNNSKEKVLELETIQDKELIELIAQHKVASFVKLLSSMIACCYVQDSTEVMKFYERTVSRFFNGFLAANLISLYSREQLTTEKIPELFAQQKEALYAQMTDFCRVVLYTTSVGFVESRREAVDAIDRDIGGVMKAIEYTPEFFHTDIELIAKYISLYPETTGNLFSQQSLLVQVKLIPLPETYMEFHQLYYTKTCNKCNNFPRVKSSMALLCLLCGYRGCNYDCNKTKSHPQLACCLHNLDKHCRQGAYVNIDSNTLYISSNAVGLTYGNLYENQFGESDPEKEKDWSKLILDKAIISKIMANLQKHSIINEIISKAQNNRYKIIRI